MIGGATLWINSQSYSKSTSCFKNANAADILTVRATYLFVTFNYKIQFLYFSPHALLNMEATIVSFD